MESRCMVCGELFKGRSDKKFCSDLCRNEYHNERRRREFARVSRFNSSLFRNRQLLLKYSACGYGNVDRRLLAVDKFNFDIYTSSRKRMFRPTLFVCYNYEYYISRRGIVHIRDISVRLND